MEPDDPAEALRVRPDLRPEETACLLHLHEAGEASSRDLQDATGLTQSRVSRAMGRLRGHGWVATSIRLRSTGGRPAHLYRLRWSLGSIHDELQRREARRNQERASRRGGFRKIGRS